MSLPVLHIWPGKWGLLSFDPQCLAAALYLQLSGVAFKIANCTNPDLSPTGSLPFLTHEHHILSPLSSIIKYTVGLVSEDFDMDSGLSSLEKSQKIAWCSHVEANLGNLCSYTMYSVHANWTKITHPTLALALNIPQRYYVPGRIRNIHKPRLEVAGLWNQHPLESEQPSKSSPDHKDTIAQAFAREKVVQTARASLDAYTRLLGEKQFVYHGRLTMLDILLAAHIILILRPPFPDKLISDLFTEYPSLVLHAERVLARSLEAPVPEFSSIRTNGEEDARFELASLGWGVIAVSGVGLCLATMRNPLQDAAEKA